MLAFFVPVLNVRVLSTILMYDKFEITSIYVNDHLHTSEREKNLLLLFTDGLEIVYLLHRYDRMHRRSIILEYARCHDH